LSAIVPVLSQVAFAVIYSLTSSLLFKCLLRRPDFLDRLISFSGYTIVAGLTIYRSTMALQKTGINSLQITFTDIFSLAPADGSQQLLLLSLMLK